jgi:guanyl-specific ribonuclease Sa
MHRKPFIKMIPAEKVEWHKPKTRETPSLEQVFKKIGARRIALGGQGSSDSRQTDVKDQ